MLVYLLKRELISFAFSSRNALEKESPERVFRPAGVKG